MDIKALALNTALKIAGEIRVNIAPSRIIVPLDDYRIDTEAVIDAGDIKGTMNRDGVITMNVTDLKIRIVTQKKETD